MRRAVNRPVIIIVEWAAMDKGASLEWTGDTERVSVPVVVATVPRPRDSVLHVRFGFRNIVTFNWTA